MGKVNFKLMTNSFIYLAVLVCCIISCSDNLKNSKEKNTMTGQHSNFKSGYSEVNGIKMYYERSGKGSTLVLLHGGGSTIESSFGRIIPLLAMHYDVIGVELQNHGRSGSRDIPQTFEQDADDVAALVKSLGISKASFLGFSNGGTTALQIAIRHPELVEKLIIAAAAYKRNGMIPGFFDGMSQASLSNMPNELKEAFMKVNPDGSKLQHMFEKDRDRMIGFKDIPDDLVKAITAPTLIINGDKDVVMPEHAVAMYRLIPNCELAIIPGGHGKCIGEITTTADSNREYELTSEIIKNFLSGKVKAVGVH